MPEVGKFGRLGVVVALLGLLAVGGFLAWMRSDAFSARVQPSSMEEAVARRVRAWAMPRAARERGNPVPATPVAIREGLRHYADHCAVCHANDGSGDTPIAKGLSPRVVDMRLQATQGLTDGELFYIIENGIRFTGMPAWATGTSEGEDASWKLVHFIRHLPKLQPDELEDMKDFNPRSMDELRQQLEQERILESGQTLPESAQTSHEHPSAPR